MAPMCPGRNTAGTCRAIQYVGGAYKKLPDIHMKNLGLIAKDDKLVVLTLTPSTPASPTSTAVGVISRKTVDSLGQPVCLHSGFGGVVYIVTKVTTILLDFIAREGYM
jgi:hypothetical protein